MTPTMVQRYQRFWLDFAVPRAKLVWLRVVLFALVGLDAFLQIEHAPRYGAGDFNVAHISWLDSILPAPSRPIMLVLFLWQAYLGFSIALGAGRRVALWLLAALYGYTYFISQLDSYQHHYFVFLIVLLSCFVPWWPEPAPDARGQSRDRNAAHGAGHGAEQVASWALRLITVQIAVLYFWATVAKLDPEWLDGITLGKQLPQGWLRSIAELLGMGASAKLVLLTELFLAVAMLVRPLWLPALIVGVGLHTSIEIAEFDIGRFSYFMFALYLLLVPDRVLIAAHHGLARGGQAVRRAVAVLSGTNMRARPVAAAGVALGLGVLMLLPFGEMTIVTTGVALGAAGMLAWTGWQPAVAPEQRNHRAVTVALAHLAACAAMLALGLTTEQAHDYYKYWGGTSRRLGNLTEAAEAYQMLTRISPDYASGHYHLATIAQKQGHIDDALAGYQRAQKANPDDYRAFLREAEIHHHAGRGPQALEKATRALELRPRNQRDLTLAREIHERWSQ